MAARGNDQVAPPLVREALPVGCERTAASRARLLRVAFVNYVYPYDASSPENVLDAFPSLGAWARAVTAAGVQALVVQRFTSDAELQQDDICFHFVRDPGRRFGGIADRAPRVNRAVTAAAPDVVHVHGIQMAALASGLKRAMPRVPVIVQDHAGAPPRRFPSRLRLAAAFRRIDAVTFAAADQAAVWKRTGVLPRHMPVFELMEASTQFQILPRTHARTRTGLCGHPQCLWVGRLNQNKDPLTVLAGFEGFVRAFPDGRLAMVYSTNDLLDDVRRRVADSPCLQRTVDLLGYVPNAELQPIYNSADLFVLGSHHEGSGFALIEALACGVDPVVTNIPSFTMITGHGTIGALWEPGDAEQLTCALTERWTRQTAGTPGDVRRFFAETWSYDALGRDAARIYERVFSASSQDE